MKVFTVVFVFLVGCQEAHVTSVDGTKEVGYCMSGTWVKCVHDLCPDGYDVVYNGDPAIIKCKAAPAK